MTRRDWLLVACFAGLLALLLTVLGFVDARRAARQLAALEASLCGAEVPPEALAALVPVLADPAGTGGASRTLAASVLGGIEGRVDRTLLFEHEGALWTLSSYSKPSPDGASSWPQAIGRWESVAWAEGCLAVRDGDRLVGARTVPVGEGRFAVIVVRRNRELSW